MALRLVRFGPVVAGSSTARFRVLVSCVVGHRVVAFGPVCRLVQQRLLLRGGVVLGCVWFGRVWLRGVRSAIVTFSAVLCGRVECSQAESCYVCWRVAMSRDLGLRVL